MAARNYWASCKMSTLIELIQRYRTFNPSQKQYGDSHFSIVGRCSSMDQRVRLIRTRSGSTTGAAYIKREPDHKVKDEVDRVQVQPAVPPSSMTKFSMWAKWIVGSVLTFLLPFWQQKLQILLKLEEKVEEVVEEAEKVAEEAEKVAEEVEKVAITAEKISAEVADKIPFNGKLKEAALYIENVSSVAAMDAQLALDVIHKVEELKQDLETYVEPVIDKLKEKEDERKVVQS